MRVPAVLLLSSLLLVACRAAEISPWAFPSARSDRTTGAAGLAPDLRAALDAARDAAADDGVVIEVNSGWRSREEQVELFEEAVAEHGSEEAAERWVARPGTSVHEAGEAIDVGPAVAVRWLSAHGAVHGLCQVYANEPWHFELRPEAVDDGCPRMYADPSHDPRMQQ